MKYAIVAAYAVCMLGLTILLADARNQSDKHRRLWQETGRGLAESLLHIEVLEKSVRRNGEMNAALTAEVTAREERDRNLKESLAVWVSDNFVLLEKIGYPGYVEQDERTPVMEFGGKKIIAEYWTPLPHREPFREDELLRRWQARDGTIFKIVPKGEFPQ